MRKLWSVVPLSLTLCAVLAPSAWATNVTVGPALIGPNRTGNAEITSYLVANIGASDPGTQVVSPVTGVIVSWHLVGATGTGFKLFTLSHGAGTTYTVTGSTAEASPLGPGLETFPSALPIKEGETIGEMVPPGALTGILVETPASVTYWLPSLTFGASGVGSETTSEPYAFDAEIQPAPVVTALGATSGPSAGGTSVLIAGTDLENTTRVTFGGIPATIGQVTESSVVATAPPSAAGPVSVTLETLAGISTAAQSFTYESPKSPPTSNPPVATPTPAPTCTVPKLKGKSLKGSKTRIKGADCKVGKVTKLKGATAKTGKVVGQSKKPGMVLPAGTVVKVTLGKG